MAPHSSTLAWKISWMEEPGGLQSMGREESDRIERLHFHFHFRALKKDMATHSSALAWRIPGTGEPGGLPSMGSHRVGHDWSDLAAAAAAAAAGTCSIAQGAQLSALWWPSGVGWGIEREVHKGRDICIHVADIHFVVQQKLTQHCKAIILQ